MTDSNQAPPANVTTSVDATGLLCPLPVVKAALALKGLDKGDVLELISSDPGSLADIPALARQRGDTLLGTAERDGAHVFWLEKGTGA